MDYQFLTQDERDDIVARAMRDREVEQFHYVHNSTVFSDMLATLPTDAWPEDIASLKALKRDEIIARAGSRADVALRYKLRDELRHRKVAEEIEAANVDRIYSSLRSHFAGDGVRESAAVERVKLEPMG